MSARVAAAPLAPWAAGRGLVCPRGPLAVEWALGLLPRLCPESQLIVPGSSFAVCLPVRRSGLLLRLCLSACCSPALGPQVVSPSATTARRTACGLCCGTPFSRPPDGGPARLCFPLAGLFALLVLTALLVCLWRSRPACGPVPRVHADACIACRLWAAVRAALLISGGLELVLVCFARLLVTGRMPGAASCGLLHACPGRSGACMPVAQPPCSGVWLLFRLAVSSAAACWCCGFSPRRGVLGAGLAPGTCRPCLVLVVGCLCMSCPVCCGCPLLCMGTWWRLVDGALWDW